MLVTHLVALATIAIVDGTRVSIQGNLAAAKEQEHPVSQFLEEYLKQNQARQNERILSFLASLPLQEEQLAKTKEFLQTLLQDEDVEATGELIAETSVPTTSTTSITTTRGQPPAITLQNAASKGDVAALAQHLKAGSDLNAIFDEYGNTAAHLAARWGHAAVLKFLQEAGANLNVTDNRGATPAFLAAMQGRAEALEVLVKAGADLEARGYAGQTPAHSAAHFGNVDALRVLIEAGVDLNAKDNWGNTPADEAFNESRGPALMLILKAGGKRAKA